MQIRHTPSALALLLSLAACGGGNASVPSLNQGYAGNTTTPAPASSSPTPDPVPSAKPTPFSTPVPTAIPAPPTPTPAPTPSATPTSAPAQQIVHVGHDQCIGYGNQTSALIPLYQAPVVGDVLLVMDFFNANTTRTMPDQPMNLAAQGDDFAAYTHVVQPADQLVPYGPYQSIGTEQYTGSAIHGTCVSEWRNLDPVNPIVDAATATAPATTLQQSISLTKSTPGGIAYAMFATADNRRIPTADASWTVGDYSNVCSDPVCGPLPHASDISEWREGAQTASITWGATGQAAAHAVIVLLAPAP